MNPTSPSAFVLSATLHAVLIALALLVGYATSDREKDLPKIIELVAGEGDNFMATEAPLLGTPGGVKVDLARTPEPTPVAPQPVPQPPPPAPTPKTPTPPSTVQDPAVPNFKKKLQWDVIRAESKAKMQIKKERDAEKKRLAEEEKKRLADEQKMTKAEFDRKYKTKTVASAPPKNPSVKKIDVDGIAKGVVGGSANNKVGGANGTALIATEGDAIERYIAFLQRALKEELDKTLGLDDGLRAEAEFRVSADGRLTRGRIVKSSRNKEFDEAVLKAIATVRLPPKPKGLEELLVLPFVTEARK